MITKLKIAFDNQITWDYELFRDVMKSLTLQVDKYEMYIITKDDSEEDIDSVVEFLGVGFNSNNVYAELDSNLEVRDTLITQGIDIYLTPYMDAFSVIQSSQSVIGILVNPQLQDQYQMNPKWSDQLSFWVNRLSNNDRQSC